MRQIHLQKQCKMRQIHLQKTVQNASNSSAKKNTAKCVKSPCKNDAKFAENNMAIFYIFQAFS